MAAGSVSLTVFLGILFLSTLSWARTPADLPAIDDTNHDSSSEFDKNSDVADTIFLPSHRSQSESQSEPQIHDSKIPKAPAQVEAVESTESSDASDRAPITVISFRPLNRYVPRRPVLVPSRFGHRCRHNHEFKPWNPRLPRRQIPYGNDMILSNNGEDKSFDAVPGEEVRRIPIRWTRFRRVDPRFSEEPGMERIEEMRRPHHHHHHHDHDHERDHEDDGLMKKIRKFLHQF